MVKDFIEIGKNDEGGFTDFKYPKLGSDKPEPKRSFTAPYKPYRWVVGTGNYIDDIDKAIVADEIRKLSETSSAQSKTIGQQLNNIKDSISGVVVASTEASSAFSTVSGKISETESLVRQIKTAMEEQNEGSRQINHAPGHRFSFIA